ncbi:hypothetical protein PGT21_022087 [Puccinia graminis f. sp. tritici]|uniref:Uncharacterized protein n=1 Tax=Puccinia graminis f. sp. tritici TaxID=56615 RepID=A0A5B0PND1_PUCGR|nr:hypothetical protein PGT21_022087 [Puccinia graminis f. sp. tritici]
MIDKDALVYNIDFFVRAELATRRSKVLVSIQNLIRGFKKLTELTLPILSSDVSGLRYARMPDQRTDASEIRKPPCHLACQPITFR